MVTITKYSVGSATPTEVPIIPGTSTFVPVHTDVAIASSDSFSYSDGLAVGSMPAIKTCSACSLWALADSGTRVFYVVHASGC